MRQKYLYTDRVAIITGAGNGLGKDYALRFAERGAKVVVNDLGKWTDNDGKEHNRADDVVDEIIAKGGEAVANYSNVVGGGESIMKTAMDKWGRVDILVNNAGIIRDKSFTKMTDESFKFVLDVHIRGTFSLCKAAWPIFLN